MPWHLVGREQSLTGDKHTGVQAAVRQQQYLGSVATLVKRFQDTLVSTTPLCFSLLSPSYRVVTPAAPFHLRDLHYIGTFCQIVYSQQSIIASKDRDTMIRREMVRALASGMKPKHTPFKVTLIQIFSSLYACLSTSVLCTHRLYLHHRQHPTFLHLSDKKEQGISFTDILLKEKYFKVFLSTGWKTFKVWKETASPVQQF